VWLASDYADYVHGISLFVAGTETTTCTIASCTMRQNSIEQGVAGYQHIPACVRKVESRIIFQKHQIDILWSLR